jgi:hypothetical protein
MTRLEQYQSGWKGDMRMLGVVDATAHALLDVQNEIKHFYNRYRPINPRHVRKIAEREAIVAPLRRLERHLIDMHEKCQARYQESVDSPETYIP